MQQVGKVPTVPLYWSLAMTTDLQTIRSSTHDLGNQDALRFNLLRRRPPLLVLLRSQTALVVLGALTIFGLMLAFHQVVLDAVARGESMQQARNLQSQAFWRCDRFSVPAERASCLRRINATGRSDGNS